MSASTKNQVGSSATLLLRRDQRSLRDTPPPCLPPHVASLRSRSSRTEGQNAIRVAVPSEAWLRNVSLRAALRQTLRSVPPLHSGSPTFRPKRPGLIASSLDLSLQHMFADATPLMAARINNRAK